MRPLFPYNSAMIIGAMKCATSSLFYYLSKHPEICPAAVKEPEFFSECQSYGIQIDKYEDLFDFDAKKHKITLEASTGYTKYPQEKNVPNNIAEYGLNPKLIYVVRNPFDRIISHYNFDKSHPEWSLSKIDSAHRIHISNYFLQLEQFRKVFPRKNIHIVDFDYIKTNPKKVLNEIYGFLELEKSHYPDTFTRKNNTSVRNHTIHNIKKNISGITKFIPHEAKNILKKPLDYLFPAKKRLLTQIEREKIYDALVIDMQKFQTMYNIDVSKWGF